MVDNRTRSSGFYQKLRPLDSHSLSPDVRAFVMQGLKKWGPAALLAEKLSISREALSEISLDRRVPLGRFVYVLDYLNYLEALDAGFNDLHTEGVKKHDFLATIIKQEWQKLPPLADQSILSSSTIDEMAASAARTAISCLGPSNAEPTWDSNVIQAGRVVDPVSKLILPPATGAPYQERARKPNGERADAFEHLQQEYGAYIKAGILFSGHVLEIDRPAYEAALYLARKEVRAKSSTGEQVTTADVFLAHGILAGEHLEHPPEHLKRQVELINRARALAMAPKARGRRTSAPNEPDRQ